MPSSLRQRVWETHPLLSRIQKLQLIKNLPTALERVSTISSSIGVTCPERFSERHSTVEEDHLYLRGDQGELLGVLYIGLKPELSLHTTLPNGVTYTDHDYHLIQGHTVSENGYIVGCTCVDCRAAKSDLNAAKDEEIADGFIDRPTSIPIRVEEKITAPSPEVNSRLSPEYRVSELKPCHIVKIVRPSFE